jgi:hypothetical protein
VEELIQTVAILGAALAFVVYRTMDYRKRKNGEGEGNPGVKEEVRAAHREKELMDLIREVLRRQDRVLEKLERLCDRLEERPCITKKVRQ